MPKLAEGATVFYLEGDNRQSTIGVIDAVADEDPALDPLYRVDDKWFSAEALVSDF